MTTCPKCKRKVRVLLAVSKRDGNEMICEECGYEEALEDFTKSCLKAGTEQRGKTNGY